MRLSLLRYTETRRRRHSDRRTSKSRRRHAHSRWYTAIPRWRAKAWRRGWHPSKAWWWHTWHAHAHWRRPTKARRRRRLAHRRRWRARCKCTGELPLIRSLVRHARRRYRRRRHCRTRGGGWAKRSERVERRGRRARRDGQRVVLPRLRSEQTLGSRPVPLALPVFLERVLHGDGLVHQELAVHRLDRAVGGLEVGVGDKAVAF